ncbi:retrovirus-related pol polyprotein from transposon TNT 1-94 [Tanacetum coccineum]
MIACLNKAMAFLTAVASSRFPTTNNQLRTSSNLRNQATIQDGRVTVQQVQGRQGQNYSGNTYKSNATSSRGNTTSGQARVVKCYNCQGEGHMARQCTQPKRPRNAAWYKEKAMLAEAQEAGQILDEEQLAFLADPGIPASQTQTVIPHNAAFQTEDLDTYDSDCDDLSSAQAVLMANISNYGSDVISEVPNSETYLNDMDNQSVHALQDFEQSPVMDFTDNEISSDSNIIPYSQYLQETQQATVQDTNLQAQQDSMILSVIEQISREKMIDSQMDDMIREKLALKEQIDSLEQNLSKQIKEKESLFKTFTVFKNESKEKENKYMENEIHLEKKIKELDNIVYKVGQSTQIVHMLTKPQAFYDNTHKQALGYQNPFYLRKAQRIKPTLYDGAIISKTHVAMHVIDDEETLILEEESRSKTFEKAKDPEVIAKKISHKPIDYEKLNSLIEDFETRFSPQKELSAEQAFWFHTFNPTIKPSYSPLVIVDVPSELPKVSLVNTSLKKLKFHLTQFDSVVRKRTTPSALEEGEWGFEHTKAVFNNEIIPFLKSLKDIFNVFDKDLLNEITEVQTVFNQMDVVVQQSLVDKHCLEIAKKEIRLENYRLLQKIMSQDVLLTVMNSMSLNNDSVNMEIQECESSEKCLNLDAELSKSKQAYNDLLKNYSQLEKHSRLQDKDKTICKLKDTIQSLRENTKEKNINHDKCDLEPINKELENSVAKLLYENECLCNEINHVKQELLVYVQDTCPIAVTPSIKKVDVSPMNNVKKVRFTSTNVVPPKQTTSHSDKIQKPEIKVYSMKPKNVKNIGSSKIAKILESKNANHSEPNQTWGSNATDIPSSSSLVMTGCLDCTLVLLDSGTTKLQGLWGMVTISWENVVISRVYYVEGLGHNLFSVGQFCDADLEVAFWKNTCFIHNLEGVDLLSGSRDTNLYIISLDVMLKSSQICLFSKASKTKSWDHEDLGKFDAKADIGIFVGYAPAKKAFRIYNKRTHIITETIHVSCDELTTMASEQFSSGLGLQGMIPATSSTGLGLNPISQLPCLPPKEMIGI